MKKLIKLCGVIALVAIIGFTMTSCPGDGGGGGDGGGNVGVKVRAFNNEGNTPPGGRSASSVGINIPTNEASFALLTQTGTGLYDKLGALKYEKTPDEFNMAVGSIIFSDPNLGEIYAGAGLYNFKNGTTITVDGVPAGATCTKIVFTYVDGGVGPTFGAGYATVKFELDGDFNTSYGTALPVPGRADFIPSVVGNMATISMASLFPHSVANRVSFTGLNTMYYIVYDSTATERRYENAYIPADSQPPSYNNPAIAGVIIPFNAVTINGPVTFNISWDLREMIEVYEGATSVATDDIYILKKDFWNSLYMSISY